MNSARRIFSAYDKMYECIKFVIFAVIGSHYTIKYMKMFSFVIVSGIYHLKTY